MKSKRGLYNRLFRKTTQNRTSTKCWIASVEGNHGRVLVPALVAHSAECLCRIIGETYNAKNPSLGWIEAQRAGVKLHAAEIRAYYDVGGEAQQ